MKTPKLRHKLQDGYRCAWNYEGEDCGEHVYLYHAGSKKPVGHLHFILWPGVSGCEDDTPGDMRKELADARVEFATEMDHDAQSALAWHEVTRDPEFFSLVLQYGLIYLATARIAPAHRGKGLGIALIQSALSVGWTEPFCIQHLLMLPAPLCRYDDPDPDPTEPGPRAKLTAEEKAAGTKALTAYYLKHFPALTPFGDGYFHAGIDVVGKQIEPADIQGNIRARELGWVKRSLEECPATLIGNDFPGDQLIDSKKLAKVK